MDAHTSKMKRKDYPPLKVYCLPDERQKIDGLASQCNLSSSVYLRRVGQGFAPRSVADLGSVKEMAKINADLGRLGGLLKLWLVSDDRLVGIGPQEIRLLLVKIEMLSRDLSDVIEEVVRSS